MTEVSTRFSGLIGRRGDEPTKSAFERRMIALRQRLSDIRMQFLAIVVAPTLIAALYYGVIASPQYVSHAEYIVRGVELHQSVGIASLLHTLGISRAADDTSAIESFMKSRDAIAQLDQRVDLRSIWGRPGADFLARFPRFWELSSFEALYDRSQSLITVIQDQATGVTRLEVAAFRPDDANRAAVALLTLAEDMANKMNTRAQLDTVAQAQKEVADARDNVIATQASLTEFRNKELLVDPLSFAGVLLDSIGQLALDRAQTQTRINETQRLSPNNPGLSALRAQSDALGAKIADERLKMAGADVGLAEKVSTYERLTLLRDLADKRYSGALASLLTSQADARRKRVYIEEVVTPDLPDQDTKPERSRMILTVFVLAFTAFSIFWIITVGSQDHAQ